MHTLFNSVSEESFGCFTIQPFSQAKASMSVGTTNSSTTSVGVRKQRLRPFNFSRIACSVKRDKSVRCTPLCLFDHNCATSIPGIHCASKSGKEMTKITVQGSVIMLMGVCGSGKTTIGNLLAEALNCTFLDADDFHPVSNKEKMKKGIPLTEEDRIPWLQSLSKTLTEFISSGNGAVLACSALRSNYREILRSSDPDYVSGVCSSSVKFVLLNVPPEVLAERLHKRIENGLHFMPPMLLQSQLELLEIDAYEEIIQVDATQSPSDVVRKIQDLVSENWAD